MNKNFMGLCAALLASVSGVAQERPKDSIQLQKLDEVVVSDSRFELKREKSGKTIIKITAEELKKSQGKTIAEIINTKSGIEIAGSRGRDGSVLGVFVRGGRGRQVLVIIDGVRVTDPSSFSQEYDLRLLSTANIASIEIIKGAASTLYGTNAATAVINITTKNASKRKIAANFQSSLGTDQTAGDQNYNIADFSNSVNVNGTLGGFNYSVGFSNRYSDGLSSIITQQNERDDFSNYSTNVRLGYRFTDNFKIGIYGNHTKVHTEFDESFGFFDAPYVFLSEQKRAGLSSELKYTSGALVLNTAFSDFKSENKTAFPSRFQGRNYVLDLYNKYKINPTVHTIVGINYIKDEVEFVDTKDFIIIDPYANLVYVSPFGLNVNAGARVNNHSEYDTNFVYNLNPSYSFKGDKGYTKLMATYATSYITPTLNHLFGDFGANPNLEPENDRTLEGGVEVSKMDQLRLSALYFNRKEENYIFYGDGGYENAENTVDASGVEVELDWIPVDHLTIGANYTFTERKGDDAIRIPKQKLNASIGYTFSKKTNVSVNYALTGKRLDKDFSVFPNVDESLDSFSLLDFYVGQELLSGKLNVFLNASNLLNEEYTEVFGYTTKGRNYRVGFNLSL